MPKISLKTARRAVLGAAVLSVSSACNAQEPKPTLLFKSGFEGTTRILPSKVSEKDGNPQKEIFTGADDAKAPSDWQSDIKNSPYFSDSLINYEQGDFSQRRAEILPDPLNPNNRALRFRISDEHILLRRGAPNEEHKARIQLELFTRKVPPPEGFLREYFQTCRLYFSPDFKVLEELPEGTRMGWFIMQEFWNDPSWDALNADGTPRPHSGARTDVHVEREGGKLRFGASGRDPVMEVARPGNNSWKVTNKDFAIPLGKWMTQEIYVKEGGSEGTANPGRFVLSVTVDGVKTVLVDKIGMTTSEKAGFVPDGQTSWNPFKIYMEGRVAQWFKAQNKHMDVYWDDLEIWANRRP